MRALLIGCVALGMVAAWPGASGAAAPERDVRIAARVLAMDAAGRVGVPLRCAARAAQRRCVGRITLSSQVGDLVGVRFGSARYTVRRGRKRTIRLAIASEARQAVERLGDSQPLRAPAACGSGAPGAS